MEEAADVETEPKVEAPGEVSNAARELHACVTCALALSTPAAKRLHERVWTFASRFRQPRKDDGKCNKTPFFTRWDTNAKTSHLSSADPRYANREQCEQVYDTLMASLLETEGALLVEGNCLDKAQVALGRTLRTAGLVCPCTGEIITADDIRSALSYATQRLGHYDIPITYVVELSDGGLHRPDNVTWMKPVHVVYKLRAGLRDGFLGVLPETADKKEISKRNNAVKKALDKIQVKAYCTDKVTIPPFFSNRDVRWATWCTDQGADKQFALQYAPHRECAMIELELMAQLFEFEGAPALSSGLRKEVEAVRGKELLTAARRCFITGKVLAFSAYAGASVQAKGGRSKYHVGHVTPLTRGGRHAASNVEWTSDDGNRIQGNDTVTEIESKLLEAVTYHLERDNLKPDRRPVDLTVLRKLKAVLDSVIAKSSAGL